MTITLEQIDLLRKRANVGYKEAKEALEKFDGNIVEAISYLEEQNKIKPEQNKFESCSCSIFQKIKNLICKGNKIKIVISKNESTILSMPLTLAILIGFISLPITITGFLIAIITNCKIRFEKENNEDFSNINNGIEKVSNAVCTVTNKIGEEIKNA